MREARIGRRENRTEGRERWIVGSDGGTGRHDRDDAEGVDRTAEGGRGR